jgi:hypothetical protein
MGVLTGQIHRYVPLANEGEWTQAVDAKKPWKRVSFTIPFLFMYATIPSITLSEIAYRDCSDLRVDTVNKTSIKCSVLYTGSWNESGEVSFKWIASVEGAS